MGLLDMLMGKMGGGLGASLGTVGKTGQMATPPLDLQNPMPTLADVNAQRPAALGGASGAPDWAQGLLAKRQSYTAPTSSSGTGGILGGLLGGATSSLPGLEDNGAWQAMLQILGKLGLSGGQSAQGSAPTTQAVRPAPTQFDPNAYLQSRGVNLPPVQLPF